MAHLSGAARWLREQLTAERMAWLWLAILSSTIPGQVKAVLAEWGTWRGMLALAISALLVTLAWAMGYAVGKLEGQHEERMLADGDPGPEEWTLGD